MEDKELKKKLRKIPDTDKNGDPIYKIDNLKGASKEENNRLQKKPKMKHK